MSRLLGAARHYPWGDPRFLPELLGVEADGRPWAEWWLGAHPSLPSSIETRGGPVRLDQLDDPSWATILGPRSPAGPRSFPFLLKVLCAASPLSIQVHPSPERARSGFADEESRGVARDDPARNYKDPWPKPELLVALTDFEALYGFAPSARLAESLVAFPELGSLTDCARSVDFDAVATLEWSLRLAQEEVDAMLAPLLRRLRSEASGEAPAPRSLADWLLRADREFSAPPHHDRGLLAFFLLSRRTLRPGEGLFVPAGVPHAYLVGCGVELMAPSDNVLRSGLTPKHVDVEELLAVIDRTPRDRPTLRPEPVPGAALPTFRWDTPTDWFELERVEFAAGSRARLGSREGPRIVLVTGTQSRPATLVLRAGQDRVELRQGESALVAHDVEIEVESSGPLVAHVASLPRHRTEGRE